MKKKSIGFIILILLLYGCKQENINDVYNSQIYNDEDIETAIIVVENYFDENFDGCTLIEMNYAGDDYEDEFIEYASNYDCDQAIIINSTFETDESGGDGSLNPNETYENFQWILVRNENGKWKHVDHGY